LGGRNILNDADDLSGKTGCTNGDDIEHGHALESDDVDNGAVNTTNAASSETGGRIAHFATAEGAAAISTGASVSARALVSACSTSDVSV
jgi:hypothetical protein